MNSVLKLGKVGGGAIPHENWDDPVEGQFAFQIRVDPMRPDQSPSGTGPLNFSRVRNSVFKLGWTPGRAIHFSNSGKTRDGCENL